MCARRSHGGSELSASAVAEAASAGQRWNLSRGKVTYRGGDPAQPREVHIYITHQ